MATYTVTTTEDQEKALAWVLAEQQKASKDAPKDVGQLAQNLWAAWVDGVVRDCTAAKTVAIKAALDLADDGVRAQVEKILGAQLDQVRANGG